MTYLFNRYVSLLIGTPGTDGVFVDQLRIGFDIEKSRGSNPNPGTITVFNMSPNTLDLLKDESLKMEYELRGGYFGLKKDPLIGLLSSGNVLHIETNRKGPDKTTTFKVGEGTKSLTERTIDKSFEEGVSIKTIVESMKRGMGFAEGTIKGLKDQVFNNGYSASGKIKDRLDELMGKQGLEWSIQNNEFIVLPEDGSSDEEAIYLDKNTGLLTATKGKADKTGKQTLKDVIFFDALLNPDMKIGQKLQIVSEEGGIDDFVTCKKVKYIGDNRGGKFSAIGEAS